MSQTRLPRRVHILDSYSTRVTLNLAAITHKAESRGKWVKIHGLRHDQERVARGPQPYLRVTGERE